VFTFSDFSQIFEIFRVLQPLLNLLIFVNLSCIILIIVQRDATQSSLLIILQVHSTCFGCQPHPSSGVHRTVTTASGTGLIFCASTSFQRGHASLATLEGGSCTVPETVVTVLCAPDYGCG